MLEQVNQIFRTNTVDEEYPIEIVEQVVELQSKSGYQLANIEQHYMNTDQESLKKRHSSYTSRLRNFKKEPSSRASSDIH